MARFNTAGLSVAARIEFYSHPEPNTGCTLWSGPVDKGGYPWLRIEGKNRIVSRLILGLEKRTDLACHTCDFPNCINERHLFTGTDKTNAEDRDTKGRNAYSARTTCINGHPFNETNTRWFGNWRQCRACNRDLKRRQS